MMLKLDTSKTSLFMHPIVHPWLSISVWNQWMTEEEAQNAKTGRMTGRSDGGWGTPSRGWDRTALCTPNVCHSKKLMMPPSWANHPPAGGRKRTGGGVAGTRTQLQEVRCCLRSEVGVGCRGENSRSRNIYDNQHPSWHHWVILRWMIYPLPPPFFLPSHIAVSCPHHHLLSTQVTY